VLATHFFRMFAGDQTKLPAEFLASLVGRGWPGNVRELKNYIERSVSLGTYIPRTADPSSLAPPPSSGPVPPGTIESFIALHLPLKEARHAWTKSFELVYVRAMLKMVGGNVTRAAERAGVSRRFLQRMVARLGIRGADAPPDPDDDDDE
jgi:DNA-binding NtrC family response regulator